MTAPEPTLVDAFRQAFGDDAADRAERWNANKPRDPAADLDGETLVRSFGGLSRAARTEQRRPAPFNPVRDDEGLDSDGWAIGARYRRRSA